MRRRKERGTSYLELVAALAILGIALVISGGVLLRWRSLSRSIEERAIAGRAVATEMDTILASRLHPPGPGAGPWLSGADRLCCLPGARGSVEIEPLAGTDLRRVRVVLRWDGGRSLVRETILGMREAVP